MKVMTNKSRVEEIEDISKWKAEKPDIKKKLDNLKILEEYHDPNTQTMYICVAKSLNGESITMTRSLNVEII